MTYRLTRESARAAGACYDDDRIAELVPLGGLAPTEVAALDIPPEDRVWALLCACGAPQEISAAFARLCEDRAAASAAAAVVSADRAVGGGGADAATRAAVIASSAAYAAYTYTRDVIGIVNRGRAAAVDDAECVPRATVRAGRAARTAVFGAAAYAARAALESAAAAALAEGSDAAAVSDAGWLAECQWQVNTLVELLSHNHPQIEG
jgi:hypothetical protein